MSPSTRGVFASGVTVEEPLQAMTDDCEGSVDCLRECDSCDEDPGNHWPLADDTLVEEGSGPDRPGRPLNRVASPRVLQQRTRRTINRPGTVLALMLAQLLRLRVICKRRLVLVSDTRRSLRLAHYLRNAGAEPKQVAMAVLYDRAWREPQLTRLLLERFALAKMWTGNANEGMWQAIDMVKKVASRIPHARKYWKGSLAVHSAEMPHLWPRERVDRITEILGRAMNQRVDGQELALLMQSRNATTGLQHMSAYHVYSYLRVLAMALPFDLQQHLQLARNMSAHVQWLLGTVPRHQLVTHLGPLKTEDPWMGDCDFVLIVCEAAKALVALGVLPEREALQSPGEIRKETVNKWKEFERALCQLHPLPSVLGKREKDQRSCEADAVDQFLPKTRTSWDSIPHTCTGAEVHVEQLRGPLATIGWTGFDAE